MLIAIFFLKTSREMDNVISLLIVQPLVKPCTGFFSRNL
ncbi:hypothetical protein CEV34_3711 [Brucella pseudogrignonensis]|uniref:Uncharacterized protein n=1 Tax=Brucella pseudogrignonensis TaxID=419475 RepID=A0A256G999_9HYPH|nr:hypothetical protein CEV34_3711 [Brucella pseudogrignonensis]